MLLLLLLLLLAILSILVVVFSSFFLFFSFFWWLQCSWCSISELVVLNVVGLFVLAFGSSCLLLLCYLFMCLHRCGCDWSFYILFVDIVDSSSLELPCYLLAT